MKNDYCHLNEEEIHALPKRVRGFLLSPFQHNREAGYVMVPEDTFQEMINIIVEFAGKEVTP